MLRDMAKLLRKFIRFSIVRRAKGAVLTIFGRAKTAQSIELNEQECAVIRESCRPLEARLGAVIRVWKRRAEKKFEDAAREPDAMGKKLIEHGAMCYRNAAMELETLLS